MHGACTSHHKKNFLNSRLGLNVSSLEKIDRENMPEHAAASVTKTVLVGLCGDPRSPKFLPWKLVLDCCLNHFTDCQVGDGQPIYDFPHYPTPGV